ncbi:double-strand break repair protein AddB [Rubellimicrobium aerolatum]|uniref:Double-strand break repair protein AddB n=1 Tax=Rubellimicrobium aerolatum TaxID=490979 RepID=A0ABW0SA49_9RHOB|nr:double-strand break repair protein AddB [Rubellimicrobium aerolatum]MBP1805132.1 double-strand break repair protein AddB [Rubellimicrobium aerolatum]
MFASPGPRLFGLPPGTDFATEMLRGLAQRLDGQPPEAWARVTVYVPTRRMQRRLREAFDSGAARMVPRIRLVSDVALDPIGADLPAPVPALRRRLELSQLVAALLAQEPGLAPRARLFDLSDSLADLMEEMQGEGVPPSAIAALGVEDMSGHWERSLRFLRILEPWFEAEGAPDGDARMRRVVERLERAWLADPPADPILVAGATGSRGATMRLMEVVARLPQGAVVLPGFDPDLPPPIWERLDSPLTGEDHPQFLYAGLLRRLGLAPGEVPSWSGAGPPCPPRARLVSLAMRPPPVTDQWLTEGPSLGDLAPACGRLTLIEAPSPRLEAEAIALRMREAIAEGRTCALVTPDRTLTRAVAATLDRWGVAPDDSAGEPLPLSPPGRLLRQVADLRGARPSGESLLSLLKHPLCHAGGDRGAHLRRTHALELQLRRKGPPQPDARTIRAFAEGQAGHDPAVAPWADWLADLLDRLRPRGDLPLAEHVADHLALAEAATTGPHEVPHPALWQEAAGREARRVCEQLVRHADAGGRLSPRDYAALFDGVLGTAEVRDRDRGHPQALIWGPLEARAQGADLVILGGMNEGVWPPAAATDPWLNRRMRGTAGLPLPERRIGQAALDYTLALGAPEAWITRAVRTDEAPTVPSRWLNRLLNLMEGLPGQGGPEAIAAMRARGRGWLARAAALSRPAACQEAAPRPSPRPPAAHRPRRISVTALDRLRRDPYSVYAETILRLPALDPLTAEPDAPLRGTVMHKALERFIGAGVPPDGPEALPRLLQTASEVFESDCAWPVMRRLWLAHLARVAPEFLRDEIGRRVRATPSLFETKGEIEVPGLGITLVAKADRIDLTPDRRAVILDYKTGQVPTEKQQKLFAKQLLLMAAMAERGAFGALGAIRVAEAAFVGLGSTPKVVPAPLQDVSLDEVWDELQVLLRAWMDPARGFSSRMIVEREAEDGPYDHLARFGEWDHTTPVTPEDMV